MFNSASITIFFNYDKKKRNKSKKCWKNESFDKQGLYTKLEKKERERRQKLLHDWRLDFLL